MIESTYKNCPEFNTEWVAKAEYWVDCLIATEVEKSLKERLKSEEIYYFYSDCPGKSLDDPCTHKHKTIWHGKDVISFIKKVQKKKFHAPVLMATTAQTKGKIILDDPNSNVICIGDTYRTRDMQDGSSVWCILWYRLLDRQIDKEKQKEDNNATTS